MCCFVLHNLFGLCYLLTKLIGEGLFFIPLDIDSVLHSTLKALGLVLTAYAVFSKGFDALLKWEYRILCSVLLCPPPQLFDSSFEEKYLKTCSLFQFQSDPVDLSS